MKTSLALLLVLAAGCRDSVTAPTTSGPFAAQRWRDDPGGELQRAIESHLDGWRVSVSGAAVSSVASLTADAITIAEQGDPDQELLTSIRVTEVDISAGDELILTGKVGDGKVALKIAPKDGAMTVGVALDAILLGDRGWQLQLGYLPLRGLLDASVDLELPGGEWSDAKGSISISCSGCMTEQGRVPPPERAAGLAIPSLTIPPLRLDGLSLSLAIEAGRGQLQIQSTGLPDVGFTGGGTIDFAAPVGKSRLDQCLTLTFGEGVDPRLTSIVQLLVRDQPAGTATMAVSGSLEKPRFRPTDCRHP